MNYAVKVDRKLERFYPSIPLEKIDSEQRLQKKLNDVNSFNSHISNIKEMITKFKEKDNKSKTKFKKYEKKTTIRRSFDTIVIVAKTTRPITMSLTEIGLLAMPISTAAACGLSIGNKLI